VTQRLNPEVELRGPGMTNMVSIEEVPAEFKFTDKGKQKPANLRLPPSHSLSISIILRNPARCRPTAVRSTLEVFTLKMLPIHYVPRRTIAARSNLSNPPPICPSEADG
jgi:hypothetical protein